MRLSATPHQAAASQATACGALSSLPLRPAGGQQPPARQTQAATSSQSRIASSAAPLRYPRPHPSTAGASSSCRSSCVAGTAVAAAGSTGALMSVAAATYTPRHSCLFQAAPAQLSLRRLLRVTAAAAAKAIPATEAAPGGAGARAHAAQQEEELSKLKLADLQAALGALGLPRTGRKAELVERLLAARPAAGATAASKAAASAGATVSSTAAAGAASAASAATCAARSAAGAATPAGTAAAAVSAVGSSGDGGDDPARRVIKRGAAAPPPAAAEKAAQQRTATKGTAAEARVTGRTASERAAGAKAAASKATASEQAAKGAARGAAGGEAEEDEAAVEAKGETASSFLDAVVRRVRPRASEAAPSQPPPPPPSASPSPSVSSPSASRLSVSPSTAAAAKGGPKVSGRSTGSSEGASGRAGSRALEGGGREARSGAASGGGGGGGGSRALEGGGSKLRAPAAAESRASYTPATAAAGDAAQASTRLGGARQLASKPRASASTGTEPHGAAAPAAATAFVSSGRPSSAPPAKPAAAAAASAAAAAPATDADATANQEAAAPQKVPAAKGSAAAKHDSGLGPPPDLDALPPWPQLFLGNPRRVTEMAPGNQEEQDVLLLSNPPGLALTSLGSAATHATARRGLGALAMARGKDIFIFDAGDDTQRQVGRLPHVRPSKIYRIFLTSLAPESVLGLPGLLCVINAARERGHESSDIPVHVYGPAGAADFLASVLRVSQTYLDISIIVHEVNTRPVPESRSAPSLYAEKAKIWRVLMPPDQLNPRGGVDASLLLFAPGQGRAQKRKGRNAAGGVLSFDPRAGFQAFPDLVPGDPDRHIADPYTLSWTLELDVTARVVISLLPAAGGGTSLAYTVVEPDRSGGLILERATAAGLTEGSRLGALKAGKTVANKWGQEVPPELVISPLRPGRRVVVLGNTTDPRVIASQPHARRADVLIAGGVWPQDEGPTAAAAGGCTAAALGEAAGRLGVRHVILSRFDGRRLSQLESGSEGTAGGDEGAGGGVGAYTHRIASEVRAAAAAAVAAAAAKVKGRSLALRRGGRSGGGGGGAAGGPRTVLVLRDLESLLVEKNEGSEEREGGEGEEAEA